MIVLNILRWDESRAWSDWGSRGHRKKCLEDRLKRACPSLRLTERKRLAQKLTDGIAMRVVIEDPKYTESLSVILEASGASIRMSEEEPNQPLEPTAPSGRGSP